MVMKCSKTLIVVTASATCFLSILFAGYIFDEAIDEEIITEYLEDDNYVFQNPLPDGQEMFGMKFAKEEPDNGDARRRKKVFLPKEENNSLPMLIWWTPFTPFARLIRKCPKGSCLFTQSRTEFDDPLTEGMVWYATDLDWMDLPLPRNPQHLWIILQEESPKNNWLLAFQDGISLFNYTSTPSRYSNYPLTTQYLPGMDYLMSRKPVPTRYKSKDGLAAIMYLQSDCNPPSDRDSYVQELMKYIKVDSYGSCLHNKDLPKRLVDPMTMDDNDLLDIQAKYKFSLAFENAICHDYITEKLWRPFSVGSVPIIRGSPTVKDWLPHDKSAIVVDDFASPKELAKFIKELDEDDAKYEEYLSWKYSGVTNQRLLKHLDEREWGDEKHISSVDTFECAICDFVHTRKEMERKGEVFISVASTEHYQCDLVKPAMGSLEDREQILKHAVFHDNHDLVYWMQHDSCAEKKARVIRELLERNASKEEYPKRAGKNKFMDCTWT